MDFEFESLDRSRPLLVKVVLWAFVLACVVILVMFRVQPVRADDGHDGGGHDGDKSGSHAVVTQRSDGEPETSDGGDGDQPRTGDGGGDDGAGAGAGEAENEQSAGSAAASAASANGTEAAVAAQPTSADSVAASAASATGTGEAVAAQPTSADSVAASAASANGSEPEPEGAAPVAAVHHGASTPTIGLLGLIGAGALGLSLALAGGARAWRRRTTS